MRKLIPRATLDTLTDMLVNLSRKPITDEKQIEEIAYRDSVRRLEERGYDIIYLIESLEIVNEYRPKEKDEEIIH